MDERVLLPEVHAFVHNWLAGRPEVQARTAGEIDRLPAF
jgi:hypothetical protein